MAEFGPDSTIRQVLSDHPEGASLLREHGYEVGEGFVDALSQHQTLRMAARMGRLRDLPELVGKLNREPAEPATA